MRIIAGKHKGRPISAPTGRDTRPTTDRVRESLFSTLTSHFGSLEGLNVVDVFAGSGALGFESLSRGAACATFFDKAPGALACLRENASKLGYGREQARVCKYDVLAAPGEVLARKLHLPQDIVFLDPPYATDAGQVFKLIDDMARANTLAEGAICVYEYATDDAPEYTGEFFEVVQTKRYGTTSIVLLGLRENLTHNA
jgi:16S rRNA (guanine966-N2)-methyltransferase